PAGRDGRAPCRPLLEDGRLAERARRVTGRTDRLTPMLDALLRIALARHLLRGRLLGCVTRALEKRYDLTLGLAGQHASLLIPDASDQINGPDRLRFAHGSPPLEASRSPTSCSLAPC